MIKAIISFSIHNKFVIGLLTLTLIGLGIYSMATVKLGSVPDITNNQVQVMTVSQNLSTEDIEQFVTYPVERAMGNLPGVKKIRSVSRFGLSVVTIVFEDEMGHFLPRQLVQEELSRVKDEIPAGFGKPSLGPITTGLGEILQYTISPRPGYDTAYSLQELRSLQDWLVARQMTLIQGVVGVNAFGGSVKQYEVAVNPDKLKAMGVSLGEVYQALQANNRNTGGAYIEKNQMAHFIRGEGLLRSLDDIRAIAVKTENGIPVTVGDVAERVHFGGQVRYGAFTKDGEEAVGGMVLMLKGSNPNAVIKRVKNRLQKVEASLPEGLEIKPFLDRSELIGRTTSTVKNNLLEGALIVIFALVLLLGSLRGGIITATTIPLSLLFAFILMKQFGVWANLMSLGAIDFGIIVDGAVIIIEGTVYQIQKRIREGQRKFDGALMDQLVLDSSSTMMRSAFFGQVIILIVFAPILFLTGVEGKMFQPMAYTFGFAMLGAILLCLTYVPMMSAWLMRPTGRSGSWFARLESKLEKLSARLIAALQKAYYPVLNRALRFKRAVILAAVLLLGLALFTFSRMGGEFVPQLDEGDIAMQALVRPGSALQSSIETSQEIENLLLANFPEIKTVLGRIGVADIPTDPMPMDISDMFIILEKDRSKWVSADSKEELIQQIRALLEENLTGVNLSFSQPVELRFNELLTGVREDVAVKLYGEDLDVLAQKRGQMADLIREVPGVGDVNPERTSGLPQMTVHYKRDKLAQYGLSVAKLNHYVRAAFGGSPAGVIFEGEKRYDLVLRFEEAYRQNIDDLRQLYVDLPGGSQVPLKEVARISYVSGPMQISRENTFRRTYVGVNARGRDVASVVTDIQEKLRSKLDLPPGYHLSYGGEFENLQRAQNRLLIVVPIALFLILVLLYFALRSFSQSVMIYVAIPLAAIGGVFSLWLRDMPFSISAGVGFIVLFGVAVLNGLVLINRFNALKQEGMTDLTQRIKVGTRERIRPIMLTATTDILGFLPMAFSQSAGAEVQQPLATVVIGGMLSATLLTLVVLPVLYALVEKQKFAPARPKGMLGIGLLLAMGTLLPFQQAQGQARPGQATLRLEEAVKRAEQRYPQIKAAQLQVKSRQALQKTAWDLGNTRVYTSREEASANLPGVYTQIAVQQSQVDPLGVAPRKQWQKQKLALARAALRLSRLELKKWVSQAWVQAYARRQAWRVLQQQDSLFGRLEEAAQLRLETQASSRLEYLALANRARQITIQKEQAYHDYRAALQRLNLWLASDTLYAPAPVEVDQIPQDLGADTTRLLTHPRLQMAARKAQVADAQWRKQRAQLYPTFSGLYGRQNVAGQNGFFTYQVGLNIPLFFLPEMGQMQAAKVQKAIAEQNRLESQMQLKAAYRQEWENYQKWQKSWRYYQESALPLAEAQQKGAIAAYRSGASDYVAFLQNLSAALQLKSQSWSAFAEYQTSRLELEYYLQKP
ncbi:MAG: CusA/CzcA family heavy metal efflux RND transporter [Schleiferiaceae bacterium]|nr:CusA/CzcA family heavy metal efflux RND transporter [Schleiferiaceae bacterium]